MEAVVCYILLPSMLLIGGLAGYYFFYFKSRGSQVPRADYDAANQEMIRLQTREQDLSGQLEKLTTEIESLRQQKGHLETELAQKNTEVRYTNERLQEGKQEMEELVQKHQKEFENLANKILKSTSEDFNKMSSQNLENILNPLKENLNRFEKKIDENRTENLRETTSLKEQIEHLSQLNQVMTQEAKNLTHALKGESKTRGNWGEMLLESILEKSGLAKGEQYVVQKGYSNEQSGTSKPDAVINLPDKKNIVIDSKVSLVDYENYINEDNEETRQLYLKKHLDSIRGHVKELSDKNYQNLYDINSPDFVLMFIPVEPAFSAALQADPSLYQWAFNGNIIMVTPSTLIATLKLIYSIWRQENQNRNAQEIARSGGQLYDKLVLFVQDLEGIGVQIERTEKAYHAAHNKLSSGKGNAIRLAERMRELGAKTSKQLPDSVQKD